jgi:hypothetical protein
MMNTVLQATNGARQQPLPLRPRVGNDTPLTRVALAYVENRVNLYLRFGHPIREQRRDRCRRSAIFAPAALFCRVRWEANVYGTTRWQLMVLQSGEPLDRVQRIAGVQPGAHLLLCAEGESPVRSVLTRIDAIEALGIDPASTSPAYWRTLGNRLSAHLPLPPYEAERHAAYLAGEVWR